VRILVVALCAAVTATACGHDGASGPTVKAGRAAALSEAALVAVTITSELVVIEDGRRGEALARWPAEEKPTAISLSPDRTRAFVGIDDGECSGRLEAVDLATGKTTEVATGALYPALSPDGRSVVYGRIEPVDDLCVRSGLVVRDLESGRERLFPGRDVEGTPPGLILNWSPDGTGIAFVDSNDGPRPAQVRVLDPDSDRALESATVGAGPGHFAPVFAGDGQLVVERGCCTAPMALVEADSSGPTLAALPAPIVSVRRSVDGARLILVDALDRLSIVEGPELSLVGQGYLAAAG